MATKVFTSDLRIGMFVADLDRPWVDTPFLLQGFLIEDAEQLAALRAHCHFVVVDRARSVGDEYEAPAAVSTAIIRTASAAAPAKAAAMNTSAPRDAGSDTATATREA